MGDETSAQQAVDMDQLTHDRSDVELLYKIYTEKRLHSQVEFYESRIRENQLNADFTFTIVAAIMTLSSVVAAFSATGNRPELSLLAAVLPALAALFASFRQMYGWERQSSIYRDALMGLERVKLIAPDDDRMPLTNLPDIYPKLVEGGETIFTGEVNQWGQFVQSTERGEEETTDSRTTNALIRDLRLSDEQIATIRAIVAAGAPKAAFSETITVHTEVSSGALPASSAPPVAAADTFEMASAPPSYPDVPAPLRGHDTVPPPEAESSLSPGALHVEAPPPEQSPPAPDEDPNLAG